DGAGQEAADLAGARVGGQHGVVAEDLVHAAVLLALADIGLDPQPAVGIAPDPVGAREDRLVVQRPSLQVGAAARIARNHEQFPAEGGGGVVAARLGPADDLAVGVLGAGVGRVDLGLGAGAVVGQGEIDLARVGIDRAPFRPVHLGGPGQIRRRAGV